MADIAVKGVIESNTALTGLFTTADGVVLSDGDYVLLVGQTSGLQNGIWLANSGAWTRPTEGVDYRKGFEARILEGSSNELALWLQSNEGVPDTSTTTFRKASHGTTMEGVGGVAVDGYQISLIDTGVAAGVYELGTFSIGDDGRITSAVGSNVTASFIEGLALEYVSATQIKLKLGSAYIPGINRTIRTMSELTSTVISGANALTYLYLYETNGVGQFETSSTAPDVPYTGQARYKTGDTSRRYLGMVKNDSAGNLIPFNCEVLGGNIFKMTYALLHNSTELRAVNAFTGSTTSQTTDVSATAATAANRLTGVSAMSAFVYWVTTGSGAKYIGYRPVTNTPPRVLPAASAGFDWVDLGSSNQLNYKLDTAGDTITLYVAGYMGRR
jgi:hypothetical protein